MMFLLAYFRTQLTKYWHHKNGKLYEELLNLKSFDWNDMVTFYIGCSFGFEEAVQKAGIKLPKTEENKNVSMYITNINCNPSPPFQTKMVVSMRSVPVKLIQGVFEATYKLDCAHGAPIHIGDPSALGIRNIQEVDFGDPMDIGKNEIPVFWACGVTGIKAIQSAGMAIIIIIIYYYYLLLLLLLLSLLLLLVLVLLFLNDWHLILPLAGS